MNQLNSKRYRKSRENIFTEKYNEFQKTALYNELMSEFDEKPYHERMARIKKSTSFFSYIFSLLSLITASSFVYFFLNDYVYHWIIAAIVTVGFIILFEYMKRDIAKKWFKDVVQKRYKINQGLASIGLMLLSAAFSYFGSKKIIEEFTKEPITIGIASFTKEYDDQIVQINKEIEDARSTRYRGTTTTRSQATIDKLIAERSKILERKYKVEDDARDKNLDVINKHDETTASKAEYVAFGTLGCEVLFLLCMWFVAHYNHRSFREFEKDDLIAVEDDKAFQNELTIIIQQVVKNEFQGFMRNIKKAREEEQAALIAKKKMAQIEASNTDTLNSNKAQTPSNDTSLTASDKPIKNDNQKSASEETPNKEPDNIKPIKTIKTLTEDDLAMLKELQDAVSKLRSTIHTAEYRLKNNIGKKETHEKNIAMALDEIEALMLRMDAIRGGKKAS